LLDRLWDNLLIQQYWVVLDFTQGEIYVHQIATISFDLPMVCPVGEVINYRLKMISGSLLVFIN